MFTVKEMIEKCGFKDFEVIAGEEGLKNEVSRVTVLDAPDPAKWSRGGEFAITTGYCVKDDSKLFEQVIIQLHTKGAAAIGIKTDRYLHRIPDNVLNKAEEFNFPIIHIPNNYAFSEIINPVMTKIMNDQADRLKKSEIIHRSFTQLVIDGGDTKDILVNLQSIIGVGSAYVDIYSRAVVCESEDQSFIDAVKSMEFSNFQEYMHYDISYGGRIYGYLVLNIKRGLKPLEDAAIEHACTVLKLYIQRKISNNQIEMRYRDEFVRDLITKNIRSIEEVKSREKIFGWEFNGKIAVVMFDIDNYKAEYTKINKKKDNYNLEMTREKIFRIVREHINSKFPQSAFTTHSDSITFIFNVDRSDKFKSRMSKVCSELLLRVKNETGFTLSIGIGGVKHGVMLAKESYTEALRVVQIDRISNITNSYKFYDEAGLYRLYYDISSTNYGKEFCKETLDGLIEYDKKNNTYFFETLNQLIANEWNLKETANSMFIHYNTIKYRYKRLCEILEVNFDSFEQKMKYTISVRIYNILCR